MKALAALAAICAISLCSPVLACALPSPAGEANLVVTGTISKCTVEGEVRLDASLFEKLPRSRVNTSNPWEQGRVEYEGVLLTDVLAYAGATGSTITVSALNDYHADIAIADIAKYGVLLANRRNGELMPIHDKGPYFVVFPFDLHPELKTEERFGQSVWQVERITVNPG